MFCSAQRTVAGASIYLCMQGTGSCLYMQEYSCLCKQVLEGSSSLACVPYSYTGHLDTHAINLYLFTRVWKNVTSVTFFHAPCIDNYVTLTDCHAL
jgi:hypothetical protein